MTALRTGAYPYAHVRLNRARHWLVHSEVAPDVVLQFGVLCDECVKCCEGEDCRTHVVNAVFPKGTASCDDAYADAAVEMLLSAVEAELCFKPSRKGWMRALGTYLRLTKVENELAALNARHDRRPLDGNSFALAQTAELAVFCGWDGVLAALETLAGELEGRPERRRPRAGVLLLHPISAPVGGRAVPQPRGTSHGQCRIPE